MIYVSLSVKDFEDTIYFFTKVIGLFDLMGDSRLICNSGEELIFDLYQIGSERHKNIFDIDNHAPSSIAIRHEEGIKIKIIDRLEKLNIEYELVGNLAGEFLKLKDPSGNKISLWSVHGGIV